MQASAALSSMPMTGDLDEQWGKYTDDYGSGVWLKDVLEIPFLESQFKSFAEKVAERGPWKALDIGCGMGKYTTKLLQAGKVAIFNLLVALTVDLI